MVSTPAPIDGISDSSTIRLLLYQSGRWVHAPLSQLIDAIADIAGEGLLLEGDMGGLLELLLLEGDESGLLLLEGA